MWLNHRVQDNEDQHVTEAADQHEYADHIELRSTAATAPGGAEEQDCEDHHQCDAPDQHEYADPIELQSTAAITSGGAEEQYEVPAERNSAVDDGGKAYVNAAVVALRQGKR